MEVVCQLVFTLSPTPTSRCWLSPIEVRLAVKRIEEDAGTGDENETEAKGQGQNLPEALTQMQARPTRQEKGEILMDIMRI